MSFDRAVPEAPGRTGQHELVARGAVQAADSPAARQPQETGGSPDSAREAPRALSRQERLEAHQQARQAAGGHGARQRDEAVPSTKDQLPRAAAAAPGHTIAGTQDAAARSPDAPAATEERLRKRVSELEAGHATRDRQLAAQDKKLPAQADVIAGQSQRIERLEGDLARLAAAVTELRAQQADFQPAASIAERAGGTPEGRAKTQPRHHVPTDAWNAVISTAAGGTLTELAFHVKDLTESAGLAASVLATSAGIIAVARERRKAKDDDDHRPHG